MNRRQLSSVVAGMLIFLAGAYLWLRPVELLSGDTVTLPLLDPLGALAAQPVAVLLAVLMTVLGVAVALVGCYATRARD